MFTSIDKALVAVFGGLAFLASSLLGVDFGVSTETVGMIVSLATPILVYFIPNKPWAE